MKSAKSIILVASSFTFLLFSILIFNKRKVRFLVSSHNKEVFILNRELEECNNKLIILNEAEGLKIEDAKMVQNDLEEIPLKELVKNGPKLVFRFPQSDCFPCIKQTLKNLQQISYLIGIENIIVISDFDNVRQLNAFSQKNAIHFKCLIYKDKLTILEKKAYNAYIFIINKDLTALKFYNVSNADSANNPTYNGIVQYFIERNI
jgi:peroxiredoxin